MFEEAGVVFPGQVVKEFEDLVRFNQEVSNERIAYLRAELEETTTRLSDIAQRLEFEVVGHVGSMPARGMAISRQVNLWLGGSIRYNDQ